MSYQLWNIYREICSERILHRMLGADLDDDNYYTQIERIMIMRRESARQASNSGSPSMSSSHEGSSRSQPLPPLPRDSRPPPRYVMPPELQNVSRIVQRPSCPVCRSDASVEYLRAMGIIRTEGNGARNEEQPPVLPPSQNRVRSRPDATFSSEIAELKNKRMCRKPTAEEVIFACDACRKAHWL